jgi:diketogulonate reductase-like aldo/keto reductase
VAVPGKHRDSWRALERVRRRQGARDRVSNYLVPHLRELLGEAKIVPHVNQIELSPFLQRRDTCALCREHGSVIEAYNPLTRGQRLRHPAVAAIARAIGRTPAWVPVERRERLGGLRHSHCRAAGRAVDPRARFTRHGERLGERGG